MNHVNTHPYYYSVQYFSIFSPWCTTSIMLWLCKITKTLVLLKRVQNFGWQNVTELRISLSLEFYNWYIPRKGQDFVRYYLYSNPMISYCPDLALIGSCGQVSTFSRKILRTDQNSVMIWMRPSARNLLKSKPDTHTSFVFRKWFVCFYLSMINLRTNLKVL